LVKVRYSLSALRALRRSDKRELIERKIEQLAADPQSLATNVKRLQGRPASRLRVQDWRVIFRVDGGIVHVDEIAPRGAIY
jgi:mRNA interferase RelE/StbE